jgi:chromosome segregation and condensation protein ScpB/DNA-binding XRE family transcriptional regulator
VAAELRRRRELLGISQVEAARRTGVSRSQINLFESGERTPSVRTYERLRAGLGLVAPAAVLIPPPAPHGLMEEHLATLTACLVASRGAPLAALAEALHITVPAAREGVLRIPDRLAAVGMRAVDDGVEVRLVPLPLAARAVAAVTTTEPLGELSEEQVAILCIVAYHGAATRRQIEDLRREDSESLLIRLVKLGLLDKVADPKAHGGPNIYRVTAKALAAMGHGTLESLQAYLAHAIDARGALKLSAQGVGSADGRAGGPTPAQPLSTPSSEESAA